MARQWPRRKQYNINGLCEAASEGQLEDVEKHLQIGVDVNGRDGLGRTPLSSAVDHGHSAVIEFLLSKGARREICDIYQLCKAASEGRLEDVKVHLQNGVNVNGKDIRRGTPLSNAAAHGHSAVIEFLLSKGAKGDRRKIYNIDGLCEAARGGRLEDVKEHLQNGVNVNGSDRCNIDELCEAASEGHLEGVKVYLQNGVDVNRSERGGHTPLNRALGNQHQHVVQFLLSKGATCNIDELCEAASEGQLEDVKVYLQNGVDVNGSDRDGHTPLNRALGNQHQHVVQFLLSKGATYNIDGLCEAASEGRLEDVKEHLQNGVDVNGKDRYHNTPLHIAAARYNNLQIVELLLSKGAELDSRNTYKSKPVDVARSTEIRSTIRNYGKTKKNTIVALQKCITKAKHKNGKVKLKFIKILFTGSGKAGKTSFTNLLMKNKFVNFHHSTNIVQAKHAVSVRKALIVGSHQSDDQSVVWLEMNDDSQMSHLRQILLSLDISSLLKTQNEELKLSSHSTLPQPNKTVFTNQATGQNSEVQKTKEYVTHQSSSAVQQVTGLLKRPVKSEKMASFKSLVQNSVNSNMLKGTYEFDNHGEFLNMISLLDTGGQPEYIHLLPTINIHPMVNFVIHDLSKSLEDQVLVEYSEHGELVFEPYHLKYSNLDMIKFLMSSINDSLEKASSQVPQFVTIPGKNNNSYLCCVGTHADEVSTDTIHNIDSQLTTMVDKLDCKSAIWQNKDHGVLFPVDNTTAGDEHKEDPIASFIRNKLNQLANDKDIYELPITWMLLELEIRKVCSDSGKAYMSFRECCSIANQTNLISKTEEVRSALTYHHFLGVLLYYPDVPGLCDYVITDHQWLFDRISNIVCFTFKHSSNLHATKNLKYNGILDHELFQELDWKEELKEGYFIALLVEMKIIAPIQREDGKGEDYFIPYILPTYSTHPQCDDILSQYGCLQGEPLLIQFISNLLPRGFFCCLAVQLLQQLPRKWGNLYAQKDTRHTYSNLITLRLQNAYSLSLIDKLSYLEVQIRHQESDYYRQFPIHTFVQEALSDALENVCEQLTFNHGRIQYGFHCQCGEYDDHIALLTRLTPPFDYALCRYGSVIATKLKNEHTVWLQEESEQATIVRNVPLTQTAITCHHNHYGQHSLEYKLFTEYYSKLVNTLPASDLSHYFVSDKIISLIDHERIIKSAVTQDAAKLLLDKVSLQIQNGSTSVFSKMLLIMDYHGVNTAKTISLEIRKKLSAIKCEKGSSSYTPEAAPPVTETATQAIREHSAEYEVFIYYYSQIVNSLSAETLSPYFVAQNIITSAEQMEIFSVPSPIKAAGLLLSKIACGLDAEIIEDFYKFLDITEQYGSIDSKTVATAMRKKLLEMKSTQHKGTDDDDSSKAVYSPPDPAGHQSVEYKIFTDYYSKLVDTLSASDLSHFFVSDKIISLTDHEKIIRSLLPLEAARLLLDRVSFQLQKGNSRVLNSMLLIMDHHGVAAVKALSTEIRSKLLAVKSEIPFVSSYEQVKSEVSSNPTLLETTVTTQLIAEEQISAEHEMFINFYSQLVCCMSAKALAPHFVTENIISDQDHEEILNVTSRIKAASLLLSKVSFALKVDFNESFYKFLDITEQYGSIESKTVATAIKKKLIDLKSEVKGTDDDGSSKAVDSPPDPAGEDSETNTQ